MKAVGQSFVRVPAGARALAFGLRRLSPWAGAERELVTPQGRTAAVHRLYQAALGRAPDPVGLAAATARLADGGTPLQLAETLTTSAEFRTRHGEGQSVDGPFLRMLYRDALGRAPDPEGLAAWLQAGERGCSRARAVALFASGEEACQRLKDASDQASAGPELLVKSLYLAAFGRLPDEAGLQACLDRLHTGTTLQSLAQDLVQSEEFIARHGSGTTVGKKYLTALYRDGLGREPDRDGLKGWLAFGRSGGARAEVLAAFARSPENLDRVSKVQAPAAEPQAPPAAKRGLAMPLVPGEACLAPAEDRDPGHLIHCLFRAAFGRMADHEGWKSAVMHLQAGGDLRVLAEGLAQSTEFTERHGPAETVDRAFLDALYRDGLGRQPDLLALSHWLNAKRTNALLEVACSTEARRHVFPPPADEGERYRHWVEINDTLSEVDRVTIRVHLAGLAYRPQISMILVGTHRGAELWAASLLSLQAQLYPNWELLVVAPDAGLDELAPGWTDRRVRVLKLPGRPSAAATLEAALREASGEFVGFIAPGDRLAEQALYEMAFALGGALQPDLLYSDHDHLDSAGCRHTPAFKPGWDPDLILGFDYLGDLTVVRRVLAESVIASRRLAEGAALYDLRLRVTGAVTPDRIVHLPIVLYHKRLAMATDGDGALPELSLVESSRQAVRRILDERGLATVRLTPAPLVPTANRLLWPLPRPEPLVSVIIPTKDRVGLLSQCVEGILNRTNYQNLELIIVDNGSSKPETHAYFEAVSSRDGRVRILRHPGPFNYPALNNAAAQAAHGEVLLLLNNDTVVIDADWLRELVSHAVRPEVGAVGAKLLYANYQVQHAGVVLGPRGEMVHLQRLAGRMDPGYCGQLALTRTLSAVTAACLALRRSVYFEVGQLDAQHLRVAFNDIDLCLRIGDFGYRIVWTPYAELLHLESISRGHEDTPEKQARFRREWLHMRKVWQEMLEVGDPFHNPNVKFSVQGTEIPASPRREPSWRPVYLQAAGL